MADPAPLLARSSPVAVHRTVSMALLPAMTRLSARGGPEAARRFGQAFGVELSPEALRANVVGDKAALWLGPDEWLLVAPEDVSLARSVEAGLAGEPGCIVDVSHRQVGIEVAGAGAAIALNAGCPLDLDRSAFPVGMCTRTVLGKADIVMWRTALDRFRLEAWRSFAPYVYDLLGQAAADAGY